MKELIIESNKYGTFHVKLDDEDYEWAKEHKWYVDKDYTYNIKDKFYITRNRKKSDGPGPNKIRLHQQIAKTPKGMVTDHINGDSLDNRKENLRVLTNAENLQNRQSDINSSSKFVGVSRSKRNKKNPWKAQVQIQDDSNPCGRKAVFSRRYPTEEEAAYARDIAVLKYRPLARLNFPQNKDEYLSIIENETKVD